VHIGYPRLPLPKTLQGGSAGALKSSGPGQIRTSAVLPGLTMSSEGLRTEYLGRPRMPLVPKAKSATCGFDLKRYWISGKTRLSTLCTARKKHSARLRFCADSLRANLRAA
jgi:hypothetical protein